MKQQKNPDLDGSTSNLCRTIHNKYFTRKKKGSKRKKQMLGMSKSRLHWTHIYQCHKLNVSVHSSKDSSVHSMTIWLQWRILLLRSGMVIKQGKQRKKERVKKKKKIEQKNPTQQHVHKAWPIIDGRGVDLSCSDIPEKRNKNSAEQNASTASAETRTGNPLITSLKPWWFWNIPPWCRMLTRCHTILTRLF